MAKNKRPGDRVAGIAGKVLQAGKAKPAEAKALAAFVLGDDPRKGPNKPGTKKKR